MAKVIIWDNIQAKRNLFRRLNEAKEARAKLEKTWKVCERIIFNTRGNPMTADLNFSIENSLGLVGEAPDQGSTTEITINYLFKNYRYIHAQLSANPPSVVPRPTSSDPDDRRKADAADRALNYARKQYDMQERVDKSTANTLLYGTGFLKVLWNPEAGEINGFDETSGEIKTEGDISVTVPSVWNVYLDPDADAWDEVRYVFERMIIPYEEALYRFPNSEELLQRFKIESAGVDESNGGDDFSALRHRKFNVVEVYEYWEKGLALNGFLGRHCICTRDGTLLTELGPNPERYAPKAKSKMTSNYKMARLPYHCLTDIDVPNTVWGKSFTEYGSTLQDVLNKIDSVTLDTAQAHGIARIILPEGSEIAEDSITNSAWDIIKFSGTQAPSFMEPMPLPAVMPQLMQRYKTGIDDIAGVNESMFGQQSRETSGFSMQYSTNQGNMIRFRLLNKYRAYVENAYGSILRIMQDKWEIPRTIRIMGKEKAFEVVDLKGADLEGGYDLVSDYGASLSLDPTARREEMMTLMPLFKEAGVEPRTLLKMLKLNELSGEYDILELAADRQREIFEEMVLTHIYIPPEELQDHKNMLSYAYTYIMTSEFKFLDSVSKNNIREHVKAREQLAAQGAGATNPPAEGAGTTTPQPGTAGGPLQLPGLPGGQATPPVAQPVVASAGGTPPNTAPGQ